MSEYTPTADERAEFESRLIKARDDEERVQPIIKGKKVVWYPQDGSQVHMLQCPIFECLYHGTRGPGKTDGLIMSYAQHVGKGYGEAWAGILFRQTYPQLADVVAKSEKWFRQIFPQANFNRTNMMWMWPNGERLLFRHMARPEDYWNYHGHEYPWIGWEELTNWPLADCYTTMFACCRSSVKGVPRMVRATTNPYGPGHNWVKDRFSLNGKWWQTILTRTEGEPLRCAIHGHIRENKILLEADPDYYKTIATSTTNKAMLQAWRDGSWDIVAGGMFGEVWDPQHNIVPKFDIPHTWRVDRSFDWGSSAPFSVGWWAESDGCDVKIPGRGYVSTVRGDLFRIEEWYGWTGKPNTGLTMLAVDVAKGIVERELAWGLHGRVKSGPADSSIYDVENGVSIGMDMSKPVRIGTQMYPGVQWTRADKRPGSRKAGWELVRMMMQQAHPNDGVPRENPGLYVMENCAQFVRTVPVLPRDPRDMDDVDTDAEDHVGDEARYRARSRFQRVGNARTVGMF